MFKPRLERPEKGNKYYIRTASGGWNPAIKGSPTDPLCDVLHNCVGYALGRFNEINESEPGKWLLLPVNAELWVSIAKKQGLTISQTPSVGAVMVWQKGATLTSTDGAGHVAIVEKVISDVEVITSESGYNAKNAFWTQTRSKGASNRWGQNANYRFLGFIVNPASQAEADPVAEPSPVAVTVKVPGRTLKKGSTGEDVKTLQTRLKELGYYGAEIDGKFGRFTLGALCAFQLENHLAIDGVCGPSTRAKLWR